MIKKISIILYVALIAATVAWKGLEIAASYRSSGKPIAVQLARGPFTLLDFPSRQTGTRAIILFASGDGGWSGFEEEIARTLQDQGTRSSASIATPMPGPITTSLRCRAISTGSRRPSRRPKAITPCR